MFVEIPQKHINFIHACFWMIYEMVVLAVLLMVFVVVLVGLLVAIVIVAEEWYCIVLEKGAGAFEQ